MEQAKQVSASWARSFLAAGIATYLAVGWDATCNCKCSVSSKPASTIEMA
jgi:hypothetical protein